MSGNNAKDCDLYWGDYYHLPDHTPLISFVSFPLLAAHLFALRDAMFY